MAKSKKGGKAAPKPAKRTLAASGRKAGRPVSQRRLGTVTTDPPKGGT